MSSYNYPVFGTVFGRGGTHSSGITLARREADTSVEAEKFTEDDTSSGNFSWEYTRKDGPHTSVSVVRAHGALGPVTSVTERKIFAVGDWTIFNADGLAVGAATGTTDIDVTPSDGLV